MARCTRGRTVRGMTRFDRDGDARGPRYAPSAVVWNVVVPALGLALMLGAPLLPAFAIAGAVALVIHAVVAPAARSERLRLRRGRPSPAPPRASV
jgi:hypothetical protein